MPRAQLSLVSCNTMCSESQPDQASRSFVLTRNIRYRGSYHNLETLKINLNSDRQITLFMNDKVFLLDKFIVKTKEWDDRKLFGH